MSSRRSLLLPPGGTIAPGQYGDATNVSQFTVDAFGRVIQAANVPITGGGVVIFPIDVPPSSPNVADDEFSTGSDWDTAGTRFASATAWTKFESTGGYLNSRINTGAGLLSVNTALANAIQGYYQSLPAGDLKYRCSIWLSSELQSSAIRGGMFLRDSIGGRIERLMMRPHELSTAPLFPKLESRNSSSQTADNAQRAYHTTTGPMWFRWYFEMERSGTTIFWRYSGDGREFVELTNFTETNYLANSPNQIGLFVDSSNTTANRYVTFEWFRRIS